MPFEFAPARLAHQRHPADLDVPVLELVCSVLVQYGFSAARFAALCLMGLQGLDSN